MSLVDTISLSSDSENNDNSSTDSVSSECFSEKKKDITYGNLDSLKTRKSNEINSDHVYDTPLLTFISNVPIVYTTKLEDMKILKNNVDLLRNNFKKILQFIEIESNPKFVNTQRKDKVSRSQAKDTARVRNIIRRINELNKLKEEAKTHNYFHLLKMCKPITVDIIDLRYSGNLQGTCDFQINQQLTVNTQSNSSLSNSQEDHKTSVILTLNNNPQADINLDNNRVQNSSNITLPQPNSHEMVYAKWCYAYMQRKQYAESENKKNNDKNMNLSKTDISLSNTDAYSIKIETNNPYKCEFYLIENNGKIASYHVLHDANLIYEYEEQNSQYINSQGYAQLKYIASKVCCWIGRRKIVISISIPEVAKNFVIGVHSCAFRYCTCCCNQLKTDYLRSILLSKVNNKAINFPKDNEQDRHQRRKRCEPENSSDTNINCTPQKVSDKMADIPLIKKAKIVEDTREKYPSNNFQSQSNEINSSNQNISVSFGFTPATTNYSNVKPHLNEKSNNKRKKDVTLTQKILNNPEIHKQIQSIPNKFKNIKLVINSDWKLVAHIRNQVAGNNFSPTDLQTLYNIMSPMQHIVNTLVSKEGINTPVDDSHKKVVNILPKEPLVKFCEVVSKIAKMKKIHYKNSLKLLQHNNVEKHDSKSSCSISNNEFGKMQSTHPNSTAVKEHNLKTANLAPVGSNISMTNNFETASKETKSLPNVEIPPLDITTRKETSSNKTDTVVKKVLQEGNCITNMLTSCNPGNMTGGSYGIIPLLTSAPIPNLIPINTPVVPVTINTPGNIFTLPTQVNFAPINVVTNSPLPIVNNPINKNTLLFPNYGDQNCTTICNNLGQNDVHKYIGINGPATTRTYQHCQVSNNENGNRSNVDWESKIVTNSLMTAKAASNFVSPVESDVSVNTMPKIVNVFSLNANATASVSNYN